MQQCPDCGRIYDESENARCPYCYSYEPTYHIVYDRERGEAVELTDAEFAEFKKTHPEYQ